MTKVESAFCASLKESFPKEIQFGMDANYHVRGTSESCPTVFKNRIVPKFEEKFAKEFGKKGQAYSIVSSAVMAYNFFHWICEDKPIDLGELGVYNEVTFEFPLKTLITRSSSAKMDVVLTNQSKSSILFIETKFTEHFRNKKKPIPIAYMDPANYYPGGNGQEWAEIAIDCENMLKRQNGYCEGIKQQFCHLVGISALPTLCNKQHPFLGRYAWRLRNVAFNPRKEYVLEKEPYSRYATLYDEFKNRVDATIKGIDMGMMDYTPIWNAICKAFPNKEHCYRQFIWNRYMKFSQNCSCN